MGEVHGQDETFMSTLKMFISNHLIPNERNFNLYIFFWWL